MDPGQVVAHLVAASMEAGEEAVQQRSLAALSNELLCRGVLHQVLLVSCRHQVWVVGHLKTFT